MDLGLIDFQTAWRLQHQAVFDRVQGRIPDTLFLCEHPLVYTLGTATKPAHVALLPSDVPQVAVERGGSVTLHNPGQLVGYPVVQLPTGQRNVVQFVRHLETQLIDALAVLDIRVQTRPGLTGLWVQADDWQKVGAIGLAVKQWVTYHGFALNVTNDLGPYQVIAPCGLTANSVGRLADIVPGGVTFAQVQQAIAQQLSQTTLGG